jgi:hypothetical protein
MGSLLALGSTLFTLLGDLPKVLQAILGLKKLVIDVEATGVDGPTKLANVLNDFEVMLNDINPTWGGEFAPIAKAVEDAVNLIVADFNLFKNAAPTS